MKRILVLFLSLAFLFSLSSCSEDSAKGEKLGGLHTESGDIHPENFLTFDKKTVSFNEFRYYYLNYKNMYLEEDPNYFQTEERELALKEEVLQCLLDDWAVRFLAEENNISLTSDEKEAVQSDIESTIQVYGGEEAFLADLHNSFMSLEHYESKMEYSSLYLKLFNSLFQAGGKEAFTDEEFYAYYQENYLAVQQIYLSFGDGENSESCTETLTRANNIRKEAESGTDFWSLVELYGEDQNMLASPDGYYFTQGEAEDALYETSKALSIGQISEPVVTSSGIYIIKRVEMRQARMNENRDTALFGYRDSLNEWHSGAYDDVFYQLYRARADKIKVEYSEYWDLVSTETVF